MTPPLRPVRSVRTLTGLVRLYPRRFRERYRAEIGTVLQCRWTEIVAQTGTLERVAAWLSAARNLLAGAPAEWWREMRRPTRQLPPHHSTNGKERHNVMSSFWKDTRVALRVLARQPGFSLVAIATLALGIGANTAIFSLVQRILLEPLPFPNQEELVRIWSSNPERNNDRYFTSPLSYWEWTERVTSFSGMAAAWPREITLTDDVGTPVRLNAMSTTVNWFDVLGMVPHAGRLFHPDDAGIAWGSWVIILSHGVWQDRFGSDPQVIGKIANIEGQSAEIIGVLPPSSGFPETTDIFTNFLPPRTQSAQYMDIIGRLNPGVPVEAGLTELQRVAAGLSEEFPGQLTGWTVDIAPLLEDVVGDVRPALIMLLIATGLVLTIACANVANLLLARTEKRMKELALRSAIGASRNRLIRQLLTESVVLGSLGAIAGIAVAFVGLTVLLGAVPADLPRVEGTSIDLPMLGVALASAVVTGLAFGLAPALQLLRTDLQSELREGGQRTFGGSRGGRMRDAFVVAQMALAVMVSIGAGLLIKSFANLRSTDPGFNAASVLTFEMNLPTGSYPDLANVGQTYQLLLERFAALSGVQSAAATSTLPLSEEVDYLLNLAVVGEPTPDPAAAPNAWYRQVSPDFFSTTGVPVIRGRAFNTTDRVDAEPVVIVNRTLAHTLFGDDSPIGRQIAGVAGAFGPLGVILNNRTQVVGVVDDVRYGSLREPAAPAIYFPLQQAPFRRMSIVIRTAGDPSGILSAVRNEVASVDQHLPLGNVQALETAVERSIARDRFAMVLVGLFGIVALALSAVGIYGVLSHAVTQRTAELGVRIALGASGGRVLRLVMYRTAWLVGLGVAIGLGAAILTTNAISSQLFGVTARDPLTYVAVAFVLAAVGGVASFLPAARAARISPLDALRLGA